MSRQAKGVVPREVSLRAPADETFLVVMPLAEQRGGGELMLHQLLRESRDRARWLVVFLEDGPMVSQARTLGCEAIVVESGRVRQLHRFAATVIRIARIARRRRVSAVVSWMGRAQVYGGTAAFVAGVPAVWYQLATPRRTSVQDRLATLVPARGVLTLSRAGEAAQLALWPKRAVRLVHPGADLGRFAPEAQPPAAAIRKDFGISDEAAVVGIVGRLQRWKGQHVLLEAVALLAREHPEIHVLVVGGQHELEPGYSAALSALSTLLGIADRVTFTGLRDDVPAVMNAFDVLVHASDSEPFGIVVIEGMALGKPVIAGAHGGPAEIITDGVDGILSPYGRPDLLAENLAMLLEDPDLRQRVGAAGMARAQDFNADAYAMKAVDAVRELIVD